MSSPTRPKAHSAVPQPDGASRGALPDRLDPAAIERLCDRVRADVDNGLLPAAQVAIGLDGTVAYTASFGSADAETRFVVFSATKALVASVVWALIGDGLIDVSRPVVDYIPEFGTNGKAAVTVEQVMMHTSGFPLAPMRLTLGATSEGRCTAFARWRLVTEPGAHYEYHALAAHWVLAELIERVSGRDYRQVVHDRVTSRLGLPVLLGDTGHRAARLQLVGEPATEAEMLAVYGRPSIDVGEVTDDALLGFDDPDTQRLGVPGGGGVMRAADLAVFYQALLHDGANGAQPVWRADVLDDALSHVRHRLPDPQTGAPANRTLGLTMAGDDALRPVRWMGTLPSPRTVGHPGAKGQLAWVDPDSGLSFAMLTNGLDRNQARIVRRSTELSDLAAQCIATGSAG